MLAIFLYGIGHGASNREMQERFQHSAETISRHYKFMLNAILMLQSEYIVLPDSSAPVPENIRNNPGSWPYFRNVLGAIDGTHIECTVPRDRQARYRNRHSWTSQNVMGVVGLDLSFLYVLSGWEGSAADMRVLRDAIGRHGFRVPDGRQYLVDCGYANTDKFIAPYRGVTYHIPEFNARRQRNRYRNAKELFNHRHAKVRNCVERAFGVLKKCFQCLARPSFYSERIQANTVIACAIIHNFLLRRSGRDEFYNRTLHPTTEEEDFHTPGDTEVTQDGTTQVGSADVRRGGVIRDQIASQMWNDYRANQLP